MVEYINRKFDHLTGVRSFEAWEERFVDFAEAIARRDVPVDNVAGFIDYIYK